MQTIIEKISELRENFFDNNFDEDEIIVIHLSAADQDKLALEMSERMKCCNPEVSVRLKLAAQNHTACAFLLGCIVNKCIIHTTPDPILTPG